MKILIEGHNYQADKVEPYLDGLQPLANMRGEVSVSYVGYFYNSNPDVRDCVFILPKVLLEPTIINGKEQDRIFVSDTRPEGFDPTDIIDFDNNKQLTEVERQFIYEFAVWIYRSIVVYNNDHPDNDIIYYKKLTEAGRGRRHKSRTFLDILITIVHFNCENQNFFMQVLRNQHKGLNKINWPKTVTRSAAIISDESPVYVSPINRNRQINFDEELLIIFFSILNYIHETYGFPIILSLGYDLIKGPRFKQLLGGQGLRRLRQIKYKYFSDKALQIWELCYAFFSQAAVPVSAHLQEYLLAKNFEIVFEGIINTLIGDKDVPDKLINQRDGKIVDHIFSHRGLTTHEEDKKIYYIGDSKYYKVGSKPSDESVYKQYTYTRNLVQWNLDLFIKSDRESRRYRDSHRPYRDDVTEGYNIIPNFFISAKLTNGLSYSHGDPMPRKEPFIQKQFENRLFDRDTLLISHYDVNFLFIISLYARNNAGQRAAWRSKVRDLFRSQIQAMLQSHFDFYAMTAKEGVDPVQYLQMHFQDTLGKVFAPYDRKDFFSLALDSSPEFKAENEKTLAALGRVFHIRRLDEMGANPEPILTQAVAAATGEAAVPVETDAVLCIMFDNVHSVVNRTFSQIAQGLSLSESALRISGDLSSAKFILLHNKREFYLYRIKAAPRLASKNEIDKSATILKLKDADLYLVFDVDSTPIDAPIDASRLAVAKGEDRISYYSTITSMAKLL